MQLTIFSLNLGTSNKNFETTKFPGEKFSNGIRISKIFSEKHCVLALNRCMILLLNYCNKNNEGVFISKVFIFRRIFYKNFCMREKKI